MTKAPAFLKKYFWDIDFAKLDPRESPQYVIHRILDLGDRKALLWLFRKFNRKIILATLRERRGFSKSAAIFWSVILDIPKEDVMYFKKGFPNPPVRLWPY